MYKYGKGRKLRYKNSVSRTSARDRQSVTGLRIARVIVGVGIIALIAGIFIAGFAIYGVGNSEYPKSSSESVSDEVSSELLRVVSKSNPLDADYVPELLDFDGVQVNGLCFDALGELMTAAADDGVELKIQSAYIPYEKQSELYGKKYSEYLAQGYTEVKAQAKTEAKTPKAGNSEAQTGLLITFKTRGEFAGSKASSWLQNNAVDYGFVLRYPPDKTSETGMDANMKAYRYVGKESAGIMRILNKCLDEYYTYLNSR